MEEVNGSIPLGSTIQNLRFKGGDFVCCIHILVHRFVGFYDNDPLVCDLCILLLAKSLSRSNRCWGLFSFKRRNFFYEKIPKLFKRFV